MLIGSHESRFTAGQSHFASALRRSTFRQRRNLSSRPASALLSRLADNVSDPILKRALKVHAGDPARSCWLFCPQSLSAMSLLLQKFHGRPSAWQEPVAFWGGFTAGALALNLSEDPLRSWIERTATDVQVQRQPLAAQS